MEDFGYQKTSSAGDKPLFSAKKFGLFLIATLSILGFVYFTKAAYKSLQDENKKIHLVKSPPLPVKISEDDKEEVAEDSLASRQIYEDIFGSKKSSPEIKKIKVRSAEEPVYPSKETQKEAQLAKKSSQIIKKSTLSESEEAPSPEFKVSTSSINNISKSEDSADLNKKSEQRTSTNSLKNNNQKILDSSKLAKSNSSSFSPKKTDKKPASENDFSASKSTNSPSKKRTIRVQIAAMSSKEMAEETWGKATGTNPALFNGLKRFVVEVDLGKRGIFYRLQVGEFYNQVSAEDFCSRFVISAKKSRFDCIIVE